MPASSDKKIQPIVIKRIKKAAHAHHGGAWKIAYADFVTAMMAFFLLMWLLGSTAKGDLQGIAAYFRTPLKVAMSGGSGAGDSSSIIKGGGTDLTRTYGNVKRGEVESDQKTYNLQALKAELAKAEGQRLAKIKGRLEGVISQNPKLREYRSQIKLDIIPDGLRIQIADELNRPMFDAGSAIVKDYMRDILRDIGLILNEVDNKIALSGHTDASPYGSGERGYSNWELSADRANASRRELVAGGMDERKIVRVVGLASSMLFDRDNPLNPVNRRITIIVMNKEAEERMTKDGQTELGSTAVPVQMPVPQAAVPAAAAAAPAAPVQPR
jgi:chemotaxis protein MotB